MGSSRCRTPFRESKIRGVQRLVEELARDNAGLCVITTRERVRELDDFPEETLQRDLEQISAEAGRALLRVKGVRGTDAELEAASEAFGNHALAINLLANYLRGIEGHHVAHAAEIPDLDIPEKEGRHPRRVMAAFAERFGEGPEVEVLRLLGLFDRPATKGAIEALRAPPPIAHLTEQICRQEGRGLAEWWQRLTGGDDAPSADLLWDRLLDRLREAGLVAPAGHHAEGEIDAHPLVREHFGAELRGDTPMPGARGTAGSTSTSRACRRRSSPTRWRRWRRCSRRCSMAAKRWSASRGAG